MTDNSHNETERQNDSLIKAIDKEIKSINRLIYMTYRKYDKKYDLIKLIEKTTSTEENPIDIMEKKLDIIEIERIERQNESILDICMYIHTYINTIN